MRPLIHSVGAHVIFDFSTPSLDRDDFMIVFRPEAYVDGRNNILVCRPNEMPMRSRSLEVLKGELWPHPPLYFGDFLWVRCRVVMISTPTGEEVRTVTNRHLVAMGDSDFINMLGDLTSYDEQGFEDQLIAAWERRYGKKT